MEQEQQEKDEERRTSPIMVPAIPRRMGVGFLPRGGDSAAGLRVSMPHVLPNGVGFFLPKRCRHRRCRSITTATAGSRRTAPRSACISPRNRSSGRFQRGRHQPGDRNPLYFFIPPGDDDYHDPAAASGLTDDCTIYSVMPHMHLIGKKIKVTDDAAGRQAGDACRDQRLGLQLAGDLLASRSRCKVKAGTRFDIEAHLRQQQQEPDQPVNPPRLVRFGEQTTNEMCFGFLQTSGDKPGPVHWYIDANKKILLPPRRGPLAPARPAGSWQLNHQGILMRTFLACATLLSLAPLAHTDESPTAKPAAAPIPVPYRLTKTQHVLVRAKINGKGPFNFIVDTGAPALFVSKKAAEAVGVDAAKGGWTRFDRFEVEGGVVIAGAKGRVDDLFQLEGINGLGLAGVELHGVIGYNLLARYRIEYDFTCPKLAWTKLDFEPPAVAGIGGKSASAGLDALGGC